MIKKIPGGWAVVHAHPKKKGSKTDKAPGTPIKKFYGKDAKEKAQKMHKAILLSELRVAGKIPKRK